MSIGHGVAAAYHPSCPGRMGTPFPGRSPTTTGGVARKYHLALADTVVGILTPAAVRLIAEGLRRVADFVELELVAQLTRPPRLGRPWDEAVQCCAVRARGS